MPKPPSSFLITRNPGGSYAYAISPMGGQSLLIDRSSDDQKALVDQVHAKQKGGICGRKIFDDDPAYKIVLRMYRRLLRMRGMKV